jgi:methylsterol monooxygenase
MLPHTTDTYWNNFDEVSKYNVHLNYLERMWTAWYAYIGNDALATGIMSFVMHETVFNKYKIQGVGRVHGEEPGATGTPR